VVPDGAVRQYRPVAYRAFGKREEHRMSRHLRIAIVTLIAGFAIIVVSATNGHGTSPARAVATGGTIIVEN
jgi:hypothetical protein